jgi:thiol-disulfide isomerase/thioredoxin
MTHITLLLAFVLPLFAIPHLPETALPPSGTALSSKEKEIIVYYFHTSRRCKTCLSIERVAKNVLKEQYAKDKAVVFRSIDIEKKENEALAEKYKVAGASLMVCKGEQTEDLTAKAFQYAMRDPSKLQELIISTVDAMRKG